MKQSTKEFLKKHRLFCSIPVIINLKRKDDGGFVKISAKKCTDVIEYKNVLEAFRKEARTKK